MRRTKKSQSRWSASHDASVSQAKDYADKLKIRFTYTTNGQGIYGIDMQGGTEGVLPTFPTPEELWNRTFAEQNAWRDRFAAVPFEDRGGYFQGRYYQDNPTKPASTHLQSIRLSHIHREIRTDE